MKLIRLNNFFFLIFLLNSCLIIGQNKFIWKEKFRYDIDSTFEYKIDGIGNIYAYKNNVISKYDSIGVFKFSESQKKFGNIRSILPVNTMKLIVFSEEQQLMCSVDNTLTNYSKCKDLSQFGVGYVTFLAVSNRPSKIWAYDQLNSTLLLLDMAGEIDQKISNLNNTIGINGVDFLFEVGNILYLYDSLKGMFSFDLYGTLLHFENVINASSVTVDDNKVIYLKNDKLLFLSLKTNQKKEVFLPLNEVTEFQKNGDDYYLRRGNEIYKYQLILD